MIRNISIATLQLALVLPALAAATAEEAARLKTDLTPMGAEKAGNKDGSIPAWTGGYTTPIPGDKPGGRRGDPFKDDKPLFSITGQNASQYADKLSEGQLALLKRYPDHRIDVYATRRTAAAPQWVYNNIAKNATQATLVNGIAQKFYGGIPFPIPKSGLEVMWNHLLRWRGTSFQWHGTQYQITSDGRAVQTTDGVADLQMPIYFPDGSWEAFEKSGQPYWTIRLVSVGPPMRAGEALTGRVMLDGKDQSWLYLTGQRRVRKLPNACCDTPTPTTAGLMSFDELEVWTGRLDRFDWTIAGKKEIYVPYNGNKLMQPRPDSEVMNKHGVRPEFMRWELHRMWVVDAVLKPGARHPVAKSRYYCDEDTWQCLLGDRWDAQGQLWKTLWTTNFVAPDLPGTVGTTGGYYDLLSGTGYVQNLFNSKSTQYPLMPTYSDHTFTPDAMAGEGVR